MKLKEKMAHAFRCGMTVISPELNTRVCYWVKTGSMLNTKNPVTFHEKLVTLKLNNYDNNQIVKQCADKYTVRQYVKKKLGESEAKKILNKLYGVYDYPEQIDWESLPDKFVIKWNFGCGFNIIIMDKKKENFERIIKQLNNWKKVKYYLAYSEMQYKNINKKILVEKFICGINNGLPEDYKLYCFNGKCKAVLYITERGTENKRGGFFDNKWKYLGNPEERVYKDFDEMPLPPSSLKQMIEIAEILSSEFPFVRVDFYDTKEGPILGEMTFTPSGGTQASEIDIHGESMGDLLVI